MPEPQTKGINFRSVIASAQRLCGADIVAAIVPRLPPELARQVERDAFITSGWYPVADFRRLYDALLQASGRGVELARDLGRDSSLADFKGIYRVLTFVLSPEFVIRRAPAIFRRYYDTGQMSVTARHHFAEARFVGVAGFSSVLWHDAMGGAQGVLEACGAKNVRVKAVSGGGDDDNMVMTAEWT